MNFCNTSVTNKKYVLEPSVIDIEDKSDSKIIGFNFIYIPNLKLDIYKLESCNTCKTYYINSIYCAKFPGSRI